MLCVAQYPPHLCIRHTHSTHMSTTHSQYPCVSYTQYPPLCVSCPLPFRCSWEDLMVSGIIRFLTLDWSLWLCNERTTATVQVSHLQPSACHSPWLWIGAIVRFWQRWKGVIIYMHKNTYLLAVLRIEHMAPHMLGKHSTATPASMLSVYLGKNH